MNQSVITSINSKLDLRLGLDILVLVASFEIFVSRSS